MIACSRRNQANAGYVLCIPAGTSGRRGYAACQGSNAFLLGVRGDTPIQPWCDRSYRAFRGCRDHWLRGRTRTTGMVACDLPGGVQWRRNAGIDARRVRVLLAAGDANSVLDIRCVHRAMFGCSRRWCTRMRVAMRDGTPDCRSSVGVHGSAIERYLFHMPRTGHARARCTASDSTRDCSQTTTLIDKRTSKTRALCGPDQAGGRYLTGIANTARSYVHCTTRQHEVSDR